MGKFRKVSTLNENPVEAALTSSKSIAASSIAVNALTGWRGVGEEVDFVLFERDGDGKVVPGSLTSWTGVIGSLSIGSLTLTGGTDRLYPIGAVVVATSTSAWANDLIDGILVQHNQDGTHKNLTSTGTVDFSGASAITLPNQTKVNYASSASTTGWSSFSWGYYFYTRLGSFVHITFEVASGTSNNSTTKVSLPFAANCATQVPTLIQTSSGWGTGVGIIANTDAEFYTSSLGNLPASGTKNIRLSAVYTTSA